MANSKIPGAWSREHYHGDVSMLFLGKGYIGSPSEAFHTHTGRSLEVSWARQVHGRKVLRGGRGLCGEGDALHTRETNLPLSVATADCVPILLYGAGQVAAVHAGWRGLVAGVIGATLDDLDNIGAVSAWIGPAIGACCYEVSGEVANKVAATCSDQIIVPGTEDRPHLDLVGAATLQLQSGGVHAIDRVPLCTRCAGADLWSYRREGPGAGRNLAFAWLEARD